MTVILAGFPSKSATTTTSLRLPRGSIYHEALEVRTEAVQAELKSSFLGSREYQKYFKNERRTVNDFNRLAAIFLD